MVDEVRRTIRFDPDVFALIEAEMASTGLSMTAVVNQSVRAHLLTNKEAENRYQELAARLKVVEQQLGIST